MAFDLMPRIAGDRVERDDVHLSTIAGDIVALPSGKSPTTDCRNPAAGPGL